MVASHHHFLFSMFISCIVYASAQNCECIVQGKLPWYFYQARKNGSSLAALYKKDVENLVEGETVECNQVCKGEAPRKVITLAFSFLFSVLGQNQRKCEHCQFSIGTKGGGSQLVVVITLLLEVKPSWVVIDLDIVNSLMKLNVSLCWNQYGMTKRFALSSSTTT